MLLGDEESRREAMQMVGVACMCHTKERQMPHCTHCVTPQATNSVNGLCETQSQDSNRTGNNPRKRRHTAEEDLPGDLSRTVNSNPSQLPIGILEKVVDRFCKVIHPWIPFLHLTRIKTKLQQLHQGTELDLVLHAILYTTMKYMTEDEMTMNKAEMLLMADHSRKSVMLSALEDLTLDNIQSLIILAFDAVRLLASSFITHAYALLRWEAA